MEPWKNRVSELEIARFLELIATTPNKREVALLGDREGPYDFWFDGGAAMIHTGNTVFRFEDGTEAWVISPSRLLSVSIRFGDGRIVTVEQEDSSGRYYHSPHVPGSSPRQ